MSHAVYATMYMRINDVNSENLMGHCKQFWGYETMKVIKCSYSRIGTHFCCHEWFMWLFTLQV